MKCIDLANELKALSEETLDEAGTCDNFKSGNPEAQVTKAAVTMFATPDVIRAAAQWGAQLLITHEPTFYNHFDTDKNTLPVAELKEKLVKDSGLAIFRFHDYAHRCDPDLICEGELKLLGLEGTLIKGEFFGTNNFILNEEITAKELAKIIEEKLGTKHVRIAGAPGARGRKIACCFGAAPYLEKAVCENDFVIAGEICEWKIGELVRDFSQFGFNKAVLVLGHAVSERAGMQLLAEKIKELHPELETKYFECGGLYSYTDD